ncbi:MAG: peptide chain release factor N(5)-glutamine methyltransferase [Alphaproteobacteria bacterium]|nr:peptide chain release factor N(5)-glutamine methyltransferase [Alphaproteobacteria bacterium]
MTTNQAFKILSNIAGVHVARIICDAMPNMSQWRLWRVSRQLRANVPVAKIINNKWFYGLQFYTNKWTLDPRPDTETLVDCVINDYKKATNISIADLGTGTACIICAIAKNINATGIALEKSRHAIRVARKNIQNLNLGSKITVQHGDFGNPHALPQNAFDVIVSNPPYIDKHDTRVDAGAMHDPKMALFAKHNGFAAYEQIAKTAKIWLKPAGRIYLEIGIDMQETVTKIFTDNGWTFVKSADDLGEITRVLVFAR